MSIEVLWGVGIVILLVALVYGVMYWSRRDKRIDPVTEAATDRVYREQGKQRKREGL